MPQRPDPASRQAPEARAPRSPLRRAWKWILAEPARMIVFVLATMLVVVALIPTVITWAPHWLASNNGLNADQRAAEVGRVRTALLALLAGGIAVVAAIYTARTFALNRQGQITERFTRAVDQLGSEKVDVRLGGIYALERLARDSLDDHGPIIEVVAAYVRERARSADPKATEPAADVQAALTVLGRRKVSHDPPRLILDLHGTVLPSASLAGGYWQRANLGEANLEHALLMYADFQSAVLIRTSLKAAILKGTNLKGALLDGANMEGAMLQGADLANASFGAEESLGEARLEGVFFDTTTRWPDGFDPLAHGAVLMP